MTLTKEQHDALTFALARGDFYDEGPKGEGWLSVKMINALSVLEKLKNEEPRA